ncbi:MAG: helix-turn-helix transcriptional regulator [Pseudomonadota bacterium]
MSLRETLASNLGQLCAGKPSIAAVCRATGINRQQFNRYLAGTALPSEKNIRKICTYFGVEETRLFHKNGDAIQDDMPPIGAQVPSRDDFRQVMKTLESESPTSVAEGHYFVHFAVPHDPSSVLRSLLMVRRNGNLSTFRRLTGLSEKRGSWWSYFNGDHKGVILERRHWLYFSAINTVGNNDPTQLVMRWMPNSAPILGGHASILTPIGPTVTAVVMTPCPPGTTLRSAIRGSHVYSMDDVAIEPIVLDALDQQCRSLIGMVRRLDLAVKPVGSGNSDQLKEREARFDASSSAVSSK